tara:strand:+ start:165 stop:446 length:282 start_codon:yes stop_codon:yes gene_type:complete
LQILEKDIENKVVKWAEKNGFIVLKLNNPWSRGWPDRLFISPMGNHVYIEFKRPGGKVRKLQMHRQRQLHKNMCRAFMVDNEELAIEILATQT